MLSVIHSVAKVHRINRQYLKSIYSKAKLRVKKIIGQDIVQHSQIHAYPKNIPIEFSRKQSPIRKTSIPHFRLIIAERILPTISTHVHRTREAAT